MSPALSTFLLVTSATASIAMGDWGSAKISQTDLSSEAPPLDYSTRFTNTGFPQDPAKIIQLVESLTQESPTPHPSDSSGTPGNSSAKSENRH